MKEAGAMGLSVTGKFEAATAVASVGVGIVGAVLMEPILLMGAAVAAAVATGLQLKESRRHKAESESDEMICQPHR